LVKLFADRQIQVQPNLIAFLLPRMERSVAAARQIVADLDARSLALGKPITRAFAAEFLRDDGTLDRIGPG
jgi:chromosomal replication initiation ATPase DnaA